MGETTLRQALKDYGSIYLPYRNFADRTREEYVNDLEDFVSFAEGSGISRVGALSLPVVHRYVASLEERGYSGLTRKRKVVAIRSFLLFLYQDEYIQTNLSAKVVVPLAELTTPHVLTQMECERLRQAAAGTPRDAAIVEVLLGTGIRLSELTQLTLDDIDWAKLSGAADRSGGYLRIKSQRGRKERLMPLDFAACRKLRLYLSSRNSSGLNTLFLNRYGKALGERGVQKVIRKCLRSAGIGAARTQTLRHTFGAREAAKGVGPEELQREMGFRDVRSAEAYTSLANAQAMGN